MWQGRTRRLAFAIALPLGAFGAWFAHRYHADPPSFDPVGAYITLDSAHRAGRTPAGEHWDELLCLTEEFNALPARVVRTYRHDDPHDIWPWAAFLGEDEYMDVRGSIRLLERYADSDIPARLTALREADRASPPPLAT